MIRQLLAIAALAVVFAFSTSTSNAAPAANMLEALKVAASENSEVQQAHHRKGHRKYRHHKNCWWGDRWFFRCMW
jgi:Flp pilus assembly protein TadB